LEAGRTWKPRENKALAYRRIFGYIEDLREEFVRDYIWRRCAAGAVYEQHLSSRHLDGAAPVIGNSDRRMLALELGAMGSHGCHRKVNDQVRFELRTRPLRRNVQDNSHLRGLVH